MEVKSRSWVNYINLCEGNQEKGMRPFALQFANCERIAANDTVFLFDEVGSGKTISAGLMAMECLEKSDGDVLIITVPQLVRPLYGYPKGQFYGDWEDKLGNVIQVKGWKDRIHVINNHYRNIQKKVSDKKYALVIVDEAHLFLKASLSPDYEKKMLQELYRIKAEKVVLATATPVKYKSWSDLREYAEIAQEMLCGTEGNPGIDAINNHKFKQKVDECYEKLCNDLKPKPLEKEGEEGKVNYRIIPSVFEPTCPVTRYFKDTIRSFTEVGYEKRKGCRAQAEVWTVTAENEVPEKEQLINKIIATISEKSSDDHDRFVIFTRFRKDAYELKEICTQKNIFAEVVTGENATELGLYSGVKEKVITIPEVLILTDRLAEQGVNLPMYNYVVNYYISPYPANLEQRFGRVDRLNSEHEFIHMCYWMNNKNQNNFYSAFMEYIHDLLAVIPSRNVLLTEEIFDLLLQKSAELEKLKKHRIELLEEKCKDYKACADELICCYNQEIEKSEDIEYLLDLCADTFEEMEDKKNRLEQYGNDQSKMPLEDKTSLEKGIAALVAELPENLEFIFQKELTRLHKKGRSELEESEKKYLRKISRLEDEIFYLLDTPEGGNEEQDIANNLKLISPSVDCVNLIKECEAYQSYEEEFRKCIEIPLEIRRLHQKYDKLIDVYFRNYFMKNVFYKLFPYEDGKAFHEISMETKNRFYAELLKEMVNDPLIQEQLQNMNVQKDDMEKDWKLFDNEKQSDSKNQLAYSFLEDNILFRAGMRLKSILEENIKRVHGDNYKSFRYNPVSYTIYQAFPDSNAALDIVSNVFSEKNGAVCLQPFIKLLLVMTGYKKVKYILFSDYEKKRRRKNISESWYCRETYRSGDIWTWTQTDDIWTQTWIQCLNIVDTRPSKNKFFLTNTMFQSLWNKVSCGLNDYFNSILTDKENCAHFSLPEDDKWKGSPAYDEMIDLLKNGKELTPLQIEYFMSNFIYGQYDQIQCVKDFKKLEKDIRSEYITKDHNWRLKRGDGWGSWKDGFRYRIWAYCNNKDLRSIVSKRWDILCQEALNEVDILNSEMAKVFIKLYLKDKEVAKRYGIG